MRASAAGFLPRGKREHSIVETVFRKTLAVNMLNSLTWAIGTLVDSVVIGNYLGVDAIAAYGLIAPLTMIYGMICAIFSGGSRSLYTRLAEHGKTIEANGVFTLGCAAAVLFSVLAVGLTRTFADPLAGLLGAEGQNVHLRPLIVQYLSGFVIGLPFDSAARLLAGYLPMDSDYNRTLIATAAMTAADVIGDLAAVFFFGGSMFLMGLTTAVSQVVYFAVLSTHFFRKKRMLRFVFRRLGRSLKYFGKILTYGAPSGMTRMAACASVILAYRIIAEGSSSSYIAAFGISETLTTFAGALYLGVADTVWLLSSIYYGEEDRKALDSLQCTAHRTGGLLAFAAAAVFLPFSRFFASVFIGYGDPGALALAAEAIRCFAVSLPLYVIAYLFDDYLMGTGKLKSANVFSFWLEFGTFVPAVWLLVRLFGGNGAWYAVPVSLLVMILAALLYTLLWKDGDTFAEKRLLLRRDFGAGAGRELNISANSLTEVAGMSRLAMLFCEENGVDPKKAFKLALCIEELGSNIIKHGFSDGKPHSIDIRILVKEDDLILRVRDDCRPFNLPERYALLERQETADPARNIGIRMVMKMSRDVQYLSTMSTNNLIIRI